jgi:hypothetical protein
MKYMTSENFKDFLFNSTSGFLIKYHFREGLDINQLNDLYEILENLKGHVSNLWMRF